MFIDPQWQSAAIDNAKKGFVYSVWAFRRDRKCAGTLLASFRTLTEADVSADHHRENLRPKNVYTVVVCMEPPNPPNR